MLTSALYGDMRVAMSMLPLLRLRNIPACDAAAGCYRLLTHARQSSSQLLGYAQKFSVKIFLWQKINDNHLASPLHAQVREIRRSNSVKSVRRSQVTRLSCAHALLSSPITEVRFTSVACAITASSLLRARLRSFAHLANESSGNISTQTTMEQGFGKHWCPSESDWRTMSQTRQISYYVGYHFINQRPQIQLLGISEAPIELVDTFVRLGRKIEQYLVANRVHLKVVRQPIKCRSQVSVPKTIMSMKMTAVSSRLKAQDVQECCKGVCYQGIHILQKSLSCLKLYPVAEKRFKVQAVVDKDGFLDTVCFRDELALLVVVGKRTGVTGVNFLLAASPVILSVVLAIQDDRGSPVRKDTFIGDPAAASRAGVGRDEQNSLINSHVFASLSLLESSPSSSL
jgi:hypothetical protein